MSKTNNDSNGTYVEVIYFLDMPGQADPCIIRRTRSNQSPYFYLGEVIELSASRLKTLFNLSMLEVDLESACCIIQGTDAELLKLARVRIVKMLQEPVLSLPVDPKWPVTLRLLRHMKSDFCKLTGCWLHFVWSSYSINCYGLSAGVAPVFLTFLTDFVRYCSELTDHPNHSSDVNRPVVLYRTFSRKAMPLIKKYADLIEYFSGSMVSVLPQPANDDVCLQFFGTRMQVQRALQLIMSEVIPCVRTCTSGSAHLRSPFESVVNMGRQSTTPKTTSMDFEYCNTPYFSDICKSYPIMDDDWTNTTNINKREEDEDRQNYAQMWSISGKSTKDTSGLDWLKPQPTCTIRDPLSEIIGNISCKGQVWTQFMGKSLELDLAGCVQ